MPLPDSWKLTVGTKIVLADSTDYAPSAANSLGTRTDQMQFASIANDAARQSAKFDFGANRAPLYQCQAALEFAATPTAGNICEIYLAPSHNATAGNANPGGVSGTDAAYTGYSSNLNDSLRQLMLIGIFVVTTQITTTIQIAQCGVFTPPERYGSIVFVNRSGASHHTADVSSAIALTPIEHQIQD